LDTADTSADCPLWRDSARFFVCPGYDIQTPAPCRRMPMMTQARPITAATDARRSASAYRLRPNAPAHHSALQSLFPAQRKVLPARKSPGGRLDAVFLHVFDSKSQSDHPGKLTIQAICNPLNHNILCVHPNTPQPLVCAPSPRT
jgi:hypothetical protein